MPLSSVQQVPCSLCAIVWELGLPCAVICELSEELGCLLAAETYSRCQALRSAGVLGRYSDGAQDAGLRYVASLRGIRGLLESQKLTLRTLHRGP